MAVYDFCEVCKLPYEGSVEEPRPRDVEDFIDEVTIGERRKVSEARVASDAYKNHVGISPKRKG